MTEPLSDAELLAIEERAKKATPGPWARPADKFRDELLDAPKLGPDVDPDFPVWPIVRCCSSPAAAYRAWLDGNADFIAHAREDVPKLLAEVRRLRADYSEENYKRIALVKDRDALCGKIDRLQAALMEASETFLKIGSMEGAPHRRGPLYSAANAAKDNGYGPVRA